MNKRFIHNNNEFKDRRRELRANATPQERTLWYYLKSKKLGFKFLRQHSIGSYIADFYCPQKKLIIELDGVHHQHNREYDIERTQYLEVSGYRVLRFLNSEIDINVVKVLAKIQEHLAG
jgi:very-short-patch-repair endonuclease